MIGLATRLTPVVLFGMDWFNGRVGLESDGV